MSILKDWHCPCTITYPKHNSQRSNQITINQGGIKLNKKGFTLIEVLIGLVILAIGLLAVAGMQITSVRGNFFSHYLTQASYVGQDRLEFLDNLPIDDPQLQAGDYNDGTVTISGIVFNRTYTVNVNGDLRTITYRVSWNDGVNRSIAFSTIRSL
jgi:type IV pilus assembly protein PilV